MNCVICLLFGLTLPLDDAKDVQTVLDQAEKLLRAKDVKGAVGLLQKEEKNHPKQVKLPLARARLHELAGQHKEAVAALTTALEIEPNNVELLDERGNAHFKAGLFKESALDFDRVIKQQPDQFNGHWRRGISLWYAERYDDGRKQFEGYEKVDTNDVENAVWHFLCVARKDGVEKARKAILKIGRDRRVPMMTVYDLFKGDAKPEDVLKSVEQGKPNEAELKKRLFYAHLYLGIWFDLTGESKKALTHLKQSVEQGPIHPYMWEVARVHRDLLAAKK